MRLDRLEIGGFLHFTAPAVLDLRAIPPGLVAIVGPNGEGKTRLLDAGPASVYGPGLPGGAFPSREGTLAEYATARNAYIDALWTVGGKQYRTRVAVDGTRREAKATLEEYLDGTTAVLNDGKVTTFRDQVAKIFPSRQQVLASAYAAQGRQGSFVGLGQAKRLELFSEMLGLGRYADMSETAKRMVTVADRLRAGVQAEVQTLERDTTGDLLAALEREAAALADQLAHQADRAVAVQADLVRLEATRQVHAAGAEAHQAAQARATELRAQVGKVQQAIQQLQADLAADEREAARRTQAANAQAVRAAADVDSQALAARAEYDAKVKALADRIAKTRQMLAQADAIRAAVALRASTETALTQVRGQLLHVALNQDTQRSKLDELNIALAALATREQALRQAERQAEIRDAVPCHGDADYAACRFLTDAQHAYASLPELRRSLAGRGETEQARDQVVAMLAALRQEHEAAQARVADLQAWLHADTLSGQAPLLADAEARIEGYGEQQEEADHALDQRLTELEQRSLALAADNDRELAEIAAWLAGRARENVVRQSVIAGDMAVVQSALDATQEQVASTRDARSRLDALDVELAAARRQHTEVAAALARLEQQRDENVRRQVEIAAKLERLSGARLRLRAVEDQMLAWRLLAQALGRDGLPKLEIDAAGPGVSDLTNQLLQAGFGTRFSVDLTTQVARADGKGLKEEFAIAIFDNEFGHPVGDISDLSGGERVVVEEALRAGILLFNNARQQQPILTCWRDETTGALNQENVPRYMAMLRRMHELGGFRHTLFITHSPTAADLADRVVRVQAGVPTVERAA